MYFQAPQSLNILILKEDFEFCNFENRKIEKKFNRSEGIVTMFLNRGGYLKDFGSVGNPR